MKRPKEQLRWNQLATYNAEVARGIVHTPEWDEKMRAEQALFDESIKTNIYGAPA